MEPTKASIKKWSEALRSGKYKQTTGTLNNDLGYCCLGVACELFSPHHKRENKFNDGKLYLQGGVPSKSLGDPDWLAKIRLNFEIRTGVLLDDLNDGKLPIMVPVGGAPENIFTFDEIADLLEAVYILKVLGVKA